MATQVEAPHARWEGAADAASADISDRKATVTPRVLPSTSLIICSRNRSQLLYESVLSVLAGEELPAEILIMDQSDTPDSRLASMGAAYGCEIRYSPTRSVGECPARNEGIRLARYDILVFTDDDVSVPENWFGALVRALVAAGGRSVVTGKVLASEEGRNDGFAPTLKTSDMAEVYQGRPGKDVLLPLNMAMFKDACSEIGDFDVRLGAGGPFRGAEDNDYGFRLLEAGYSIHYVPQAVVYHRAWRTEKDFLPLRWSYGIARGAFYAKYLSFSDRYMLNRLRGDLARHNRQYSPANWWLSRRQTLADAVFTVGLLYGAAKWLMTQPRERASGLASS